MNRKDGKRLLRKIDFKAKISRAKENFLDKLNIPEELVYDYSKITMVENSQLMIEGYNNIVDYYDNYIKIQAKNVYVIIDGKGLKIDEINDSELLISGDINNIGFMKR